MIRRIQIGLAVAYLALLFIQLPAFPEAGLPILAADMIFPLFALSLLPEWRQGVAWLKDWRESAPLVLFLLWSTIAVFFHGGIYNLAVFFYMSAIFLAFRVLRLSSLAKFRIGFAMLVILVMAFFRAWLWRKCFGMENGMFFIDPNLPPADHAMLGSRFQFLFSNPNLLGSFYILPLMLCRDWLEENYAVAITNVPRLLVAVAIAVVFLLPLYSSVSKHAIVSLALVGAMFCHAPVLQKIRPRLITCIVIGLFGIVALLSITWKTFPLTDQFPYVDTSLPANYALHRQVYAKVVTADVPGMLVGHSPDRIRQLYPQFADQDEFAKVLAAYNSRHLAEGYATFMDPHCEFLNLAAFFGIPAAVCCVLFLISRIRNRKFGTAITIVALLLCCCWDDLLSKRWIWATLGNATE